MDTQTYRHLLDELAELFAPEKTADLKNEGVVEIENRDFLLHYDEAFDPDLLLVRVCVDEDDRFADEPDLLKGLLKTNYLTGYTERVTFSMHPESERVVLTFWKDIRDVRNAQQLREALIRTRETVDEAWSKLCAIFTAVQKPAFGTASVLMP